MFYFSDHQRFYWGQEGNHLPLSSLKGKSSSHMESAAAESFNKKRPLTKKNKLKLKKNVNGQLWTLFYKLLYFGKYWIYSLKKKLNFYFLMNTKLFLSFLHCSSLPSLLISSHILSTSLPMKSSESYDTVQRVVFFVTSFPRVKLRSKRRP